MIKELFATCLLSASVGTSGLNMQTRDYVGGMDYDLADNNPSAWVTTGTYSDDTDPTSLKRYRQQTQVINGQEVSCKTIRKTAISYTSGSYDVQEGYDIFCFTITNRLNIIYNEISLEPVWNLQNTANGTRTRVFTTYDASWFTAFNELTYNNFTKYQQFIDKINSGQLGYNYDVNADVTDTKNPIHREVQINLQSKSTNYMFIVMQKNWLYPNPLQYTTDIYQLTYLDMAVIAYMTIDTATYDQEVIDIPGLMFTVLTMPFTFISQAFNVTLFPGTPYQVNISALIIAIISAIILAWILGLIIKGLK